jgi:hypothetical protein
MMEKDFPAKADIGFAYTGPLASKVSEVRVSASGVYPNTIWVQVMVEGQGDAFVGIDAQTAVDLGIALIRLSQEVK